MTREKMHEWLKLHKHIETRGDREFESPYAEGCDDGYTYAEMNFQSRTCVDCAYFYESTLGEFHCRENTNGVHYVEKDFGCLKFERKEDV